MRRKPHIFINGIEHKECCTCKGIFLLSPENFNKNKQRWDGVTQQCKKCIKNDYNKNIISILANKRDYLVRKKPQIQAYRRKYRLEHPELLAERQREYWTDNHDRLIIENRERGRKNKERYEQGRDKEKKREACRRFFKTDKGRMVSRLHDQRRKSQKNFLPATLTLKQWEECCKVFNNRCAYCGEDRLLEQDHFLASGNRGEYSRENIVPACKSCNSSKRDRNFFTWYQMKKYYSKEREQAILKYLGYKQGKQQLALF